MGVTILFRVPVYILRTLGMYYVHILQEMLGRFDGLRPVKGAPLHG